MKQIITAESLRINSFALASKVATDKFQPDFMVALWRGGAPIGCYVHEFLKYIGNETDHIAIRTSRYTGVDRTQSNIQVHNLGYLTEKLNKSSKVLLVDDVYDSGLTIEAVYATLQKKLGDNYPSDIRVATVYYKPKRNKSGKKPDYFIHETDNWLIFPHELEGLSLEELDPEIVKLLSTVI